jgi:F420-0:gamma-glutamyl ligase-like protein
MLKQKVIANLKEKPKPESGSHKQTMIKSTTEIAV